MSPLAVIGIVTGIAQAADIVVPAKGEPDGVDRVANQTITSSRSSCNQLQKQL